MSNPTTPTPESPDDIIQVNRLGVQATTRRGDMQEGDVPISQATVAGQQARDQQREALSTLDNKVGTFVEGAVDALSLGLIRERSDAADVRREVNSGSALAGQLFGGAMSLKVPGFSAIAEAGGNVGKVVADSAGMGEILARGATDAGIGAALGGAGAIGHQAFDSLLEDKEFSMEAVAKETGLSGLLGFGLGVLGGGLGKAKGPRGEALGSTRVSAGDMAAQGGFMDPSSPEYLSATDHVAQAVRGMDDALGVHEARLGGLQSIEDKGWFNLDSDAMKARNDALKAAKAARAKLPDNVVAAMKNADPALSAGIDDYEDALHALDSAMKPGQLERFQPQQLGKPLEPMEMYQKLDEGNRKFYEGGSFEDHYYGPDDVPMQNFGVNANMQADLPDAMVESGGPLGKQFRPGIKDPAARYAEIYGKPWEPVSEGAPLPDEFGAPPPGGQVTPTSELGTNVGKAKATPRQAASEALDAFGPDRSFDAVPPGERSFMPDWMPEGGRTQVSGMPEGMKFPGEISPEAAEMGERGGRELTPHDPSDALNGNYRQGSLNILPDGAMLPTVDVKANAEAFAAFQDKMANDTMAARARKAASLEKFRAERAGQIANLEPAPLEAAPEPNLSRGKGPEYRDTSVESAQDIKGRNNQNAIDANLAQDIQAQQAAAPSGGPDDLSRLNDFLGLKAEAPEPPAVSARRFLDAWFDEAQSMGPRITPGDLAASRIQSSADALYGATGGRADSVSALDLAGEHGMHQARGNLATRIQQVQLLPKAAQYVQKLASIGGAEGAQVKAPAGGKSSKIGNWAKRKIGGIAGAKMGAAVGGPIGGIVGYQLGAEAVGNYAKAATQMASATGRAAMRCAAVGDALLAGGRGGAAAASVVNRAYAYSPEGPIKDPVERILEIQRIAASPDSIREMVQQQAGDLAVIHPGVAKLLEDHAVNQVMAISIQAPHIYFDQLGKPISPSAGEMRKFLEYEATAHNLDRTLIKMGKGQATATEIKAVNDLAPKHMQRVVSAILDNPERMAHLSRLDRARIETMTGLPLTGRSNPQFVATQQASWQKYQAGAQQSGPNNPQALKPSAQGMTTPGTGGLAGRAPGN